ncbi:hypothetical protein VPH35_089104 [Triticum aestivum]|uniref:uncharacterized protein isoform X2 n=1 Tax=Triticum aestivum TaxID=4565 RepID=UPI001D034B79|nr:uncharacterized protein LOC123111088 isoform X2 [Triticum aestivum]
MKLARTTPISFPQSPQLASGMQSTPASGGALRMQRWMETRLTHTMMLVRFVANSNDMPPEDISDATVRKEEDAEGMFVSNSNGSSWTRRTRIGKAAYEREINPSRFLLSRFQYMLILRKKTGDDPTWIPGGSSETCLETLDEGSKKLSS